MGLSFPSGEELDRIAISAEGETDVLKPITFKDGYLNLSGIETQSMRCLEALKPEERPWLVREVFYKLADSVVKMTKYLNTICGADKFIFAGGVSSSEYIRNYLKENLPKEFTVIFGDPELSGDNAVGTALLGLRK